MAVNVSNVGTVNFQSSPQNLAQTNNLGAAWYGSDFGAKTSGGNSNAIQKEESLGIKFTGSYNSIVTALTASTLRVGIHVGSLPNSASDTYVNSGCILNCPVKPVHVPEPVSSLFGLATLATVGRLKKKI